MLKKHLFALITVACLTILTSCVHETKAASEQTAVPVQVRTPAVVERAESVSASGSIEGVGVPEKRFPLSCIVKDHPKRMTLPAANGTHAVAHRYAIDTARPALGTVIDRKDDGLALAKRNDGDAGLHARTLLGEHELSAGEVASGLTEKKSYLERKEDVAVEVLMQAVVVAGLVAEQQWRGSLLPCLVTDAKKLGVLGWKSLLNVERRIPLVGNACQPRIERLPQRLNDGRQRIAVVLILAASEAMPRHDHATAELRCRVVAVGEGGAVFDGEKAAGRSVAILIESLGDAGPI